MKPRARRIALLTVAAGCLVVAGLAAFNWPTVRDHAEAWWFIWTKETRTLKPLRISTQETQTLESIGTLEAVGKRRWSSVPALGYLQLVASFTSMPVICEESLSRDSKMQLLACLPPGVVDPVKLLRENGYRILEQRFPRQAYVVVSYPDVGRTESPSRLRGGVSPTLELKASPR
jgi:hypothetical protein